MTKSNWKKYKLGDVVSLHTQKRKCADTSLYNYISTENMLSDKGGIVPAATIPSKGTVSIYQKDDILISNIRPYFKKIWYATVDGTASNDVIIFRANDKVYNRYLYYILADDNFFAYVMTGAKGTKMPRGDKQQILKYQVNLPHIDEQKRIAGILGAFDDKIELLQKQNKTLEDMAKALFKSWFVDFDIVKAKQQGRPKADIIREYHLTQELYDLFPSDFENSSLGPIPLGWQVKKIMDIAKISSGKRPNSAVENKTEKNIIPVYGGNGIKWWTNKPLYTKPIIITGRVGTLGQVYRIYNPVWVSDNALIFETDTVNFEYLFLALHNIDFYSFNRGSTQPLITQGDIKNISLAYNINLTYKFHNIVNKLEEKIINNTKQIQTLTELRDTLLPRLISGKIRV